MDGSRVRRVMKDFERVLVPTDFSDAAEQAWTTATRLACALGAELLLLHVFVETPLFSETPFSARNVRDVYEAQRAWVEKELEQWAIHAREAGARARTLLRTGAPHHEILAAVDDQRADLIVMGTHGRGGVERALLGSVADRVVRLARCPVLSVRARP
ncbi:MAG: universal stress protein [Candidatus Rokubacteria bacterium]|nr:universal stress protein [Candidatus Rokubacteria bacterium]